MQASSSVLVFILQASSVLEHEFSLYDRFAWLGMSVLDTVAKKALTNTSKQFGSSELWNTIKKRVCEDVYILLYVTCYPEQC